MHLIEILIIMDFEFRKAHYDHINLVVTVSQLIKRRKFQLIDTLPNLNLMISISGAKCKIRAYYLNLFNYKILGQDVRYSSFLLSGFLDRPNAFSEVA